MISSRFQTAFAPQVMKRTAKLPNTPTSFAKARGIRMMSTTSSDLNACHEQPGNLVDEARERATAPLNQAKARGIAFAFCIVFQVSSSPMNFMKPPSSDSASCGTGSPVIGSLPIIVHSSG